jgi:uncharacterized protein (TIGR02679 family)
MTDSVDLGRARALFDGEPLGWIVERLRARMERGQPLGARIRLTHPTPAQREAVDRLLGRRPAAGPPTSISVDPTELVRVIERAGIAPDLRALVEALEGPVADRIAEAEAERARWQDAHRLLRSGVVDTKPELADWVDSVEASGLIRRLARDAEAAGALAERAARVLDRLPAGGVPLARLAAATLGDSHALDEGTPVATLVLGAVETLTGEPRRDRSASERRALWARVGVLVDELSAPVLVLGLRPEGDGLIVRTLRAHADAGEPCRLTLRQMVRHPVDWTRLGRRTVAVCENPTVVAAVAERLGPRSPPLVCTDGQPSGAVQSLLRQLADAGIELRFHTDFDRGGIRLGNLLVDRFGGIPWRMTRADYERVADGGVPLGTEPEEAAWDRALATVMRARGRAVHEELVLDELLRDLEGW